jgi:hypothetical protein
MMQQKAASTPAVEDIIELIRRARQGDQTDRTPIAPPPQDIKTPAAAFRRLFDLRGAENRALLALMSSDFVSKAEMRCVVSPYGNPKSNVEGAVISTLRRKLRPHGVEIVNIHGSYRLGEVGWDKIRRLLDDGCRLPTAATSPEAV